MADFVDMATPGVAIVDDGQHVWAVDTDDLLVALARLGWMRDGRVWLEPPGPEDDPAGAPYARLCDATSALADGPDVWDHYPRAAVLQYAPQHGLGAWLWAEANGA